MNLEDRLKEAMRSRVSRVEAPLDAWSGIERRLTRPKRRSRAVFVAGLTFLLTGGMFWGLTAAFRPSGSQDPGGSVVGQPGLHVSSSTILPSAPDAVTVDSSGAWVTLPPSGQGVEVIHVAGTGAAERTITLEQTLGSLIGGAGRLWGIAVAGIDPNITRSLVSVDAATGREVTRTTGIAAPIASGYGSVWGVADDGTDHSVVRIDPTNGAIVARVQVGSPISSITVGESGLVWVTSSPKRLAQAIDQSTNEPVRTVNISFPGDIGSPVAGDGALWIPLSTVGGEELLRVDAASGELMQPIAIGTAVPFGYGAGRLWLIGDDGILQGFDPKNSEVDVKLDVGTPAGKGFPTAAVQGDRAVWVGTLAGSLVRVDIPSA